jgi:hypothetical protein
MTGNKYHNVKTRGYDSRKEAERARVLHLLEKAGKIRELREQVKYELVPAQYENLSQRRPNDPSTASRSPSPASRGGFRGKLVERSVNYIADFVYVDCATGETVVEDAKGVRTKEYIIKRKLMRWVHGIKISEV